jgi:hypothetical protein
LTDSVQTNSRRLVRVAKFSVGALTLGLLAVLLLDPVQKNAPMALGQELAGNQPRHGRLSGARL